MPFLYDAVSALELFLDSYKNVTTIATHASQLAVG